MKNIFTNKKIYQMLGSKGPALISGKKPKAKGKTTPNTNRRGKTLYDKGKEFLGNVAGHAIQGVKDDVKTLGKVFKRNAKRGQK